MSHQDVAPQTRGDNYAATLAHLRSQRDDAPPPKATMSDSGRRAADRDTILRFVRVAFGGIAIESGHMGWRAFPNDSDQGPPDVRWGPFPDMLVSRATEFATEIANRTGRDAAVFATPVCVFGSLTFKGKLRASEDNVIACRVIVLELDERPAAALARACEILGMRPTLLIQSGGMWRDPDSGIEEPKLHAYWQLVTVAETPTDLERLRKIRRGLTKLCGGDPSAAPLSHPLRWPGSWHTKGEPVLCTIVEEANVKLGLDAAELAIENAAFLEGLDLDAAPIGVAPRRQGFKTAEALGRATLMALAGAINNPDDLPWHDWNTRSMTFFDASHGSSDGLDALHEWSAKNETKYDPDVTDDRWSHYGRSPPSRLGAGSLFHFAEQDSPGVAIPTRDPVDPSEAFDAEAGVPTYIRDLNRRHAFVMNNGEAAVLNENGPGRYSFSSRRSFEDRYANQTVRVDNKDQSVAVLWRKHPARRQYPNGVEFAPEGVPPGVYNLWRGIQPAGPPGGSCELILAHIRDILCAGNTASFRYLIGWLAHMVQRPEEKPGVCVVLQGEKGTGKDTLGYYLDAMMPGLRLGVSQQEQVVGRFNGHLSAVLLLHVEEAFWAGSKQAESALKALITSPTLAAEFKGLTPFTVRSKLRVLMTSNENWVVPASEDERRFFVVKVSPRRRRDTAYFGAIYAERDAGGAVALLAYLRAVDLSGFDVRAVPTTDALRDQKLASLRNFDLWYREQLAEGTFWSEDGSAHPVERQRFYDAYRAWLERRRYDGSVWTKEQVGRRLRELLAGHDIETRPRAEDQKRYYAYAFPSLAVCRSSWEARYEVTGIFPTAGP